MSVSKIDPIHDTRWRDLVTHHPDASIFHTPEWLEALKRTYGYESAAVTSAAAGEKLRDGLVFCRVRSWLTGRRVVSVPFADHCSPLVENDDDLQGLMGGLKSDAEASGASYVEIRPIQVMGSLSGGLEKTSSSCFHQLDLNPSLDEIFHGLHKDCIQRKILRAERESLNYAEGNSRLLLEHFYRLLVLTRRRHQLAPQPIAWFRNLITCMGDKLKIRVASKSGCPVAAILTLRHKDTLVYKYGSSDAQFHNLGGMQLLFWRAIEEAKRSGLRVFDLGRSDWQTPGLIKFKDRWGAQRRVLTYLRYFTSRYRAPSTKAAGLGLRQRIERIVFPRLPNRLLCAAGSLIYRHLG